MYHCLADTQVCTRYTASSPASVGTVFTVVLIEVVKYEAGNFMMCITSGTPFLRNLWNKSCTTFEPLYLTDMHRDSRVSFLDSATVRRIYTYGSTGFASRSVQLFRLTPLSRSESFVYFSLRTPSQTKSWSIYIQMWFLQDRTPPRFSADERDFWH